MCIPFPEPWEFWKGRIYASLLTFRDFRHCCTMIFKVERTLKCAKTVERNSTMCECIFYQLAVKNVNVNVVIPIYCQHNLMFLRKKNYSIQYLTGQSWGSSRLKIYLAGHHDQWPAVCYFQPCCIWDCTGTSTVLITFKYLFMTHARWTDDFSSQKEQFIYISIIIITLSFHVKGSLIIGELRVCKTVTQQLNQKRLQMNRYTVYSGTLL